MAPSRYYFFLALGMQTQSMKEHLVVILVRTTIVLRLIKNKYRIYGRVPVLTYHLSLSLTDLLRQNVSN